MHIETARPFNKAMFAVAARTEVGIYVELNQNMLSGQGQGM